MPNFKTPKPGTDAERNPPRECGEDSDDSHSLALRVSLADDDGPDTSWLARGREQLVAAGLLDYDQGCDAALAEAQTRAAAVGDGELLALVDAVRQQRAAASPSGGATLGQELDAAMKLVQQGNLAAATPRLEKSLAQARAGGDPVAVATCQLFLGQVRLMSARAAVELPGQARWRRFLIHDHA